MSVFRRPSWFRRPWWERPAEPAAVGPVAPAQRPGTYVPRRLLHEIDRDLRELSWRRSDFEQARWTAEVDGLLEQRRALALPRRTPSVPRVPGWSS